MRTLVAIALAALMALPATAANQWSVAIEKLEKSVVQIAANCSAFVVNTEKHYVLSAAHCGNEDLNQPVLVDLKPAKVVAMDVQKDFVVLQVPDLDRPQLQMADNDPAIGDEVASYGYGYGLETPMLRIAYVSQNKAIIPEAGGGEWIMLDKTFVGGQSGSPIVNQKGEVVALVQRGNNLIGIGRGIEKIKDRVGKYWGKAPTK